MSDLIEPRVLKGFRDFLPQDEIVREDLQEKLTSTYRAYGFVPIDTPILEYTEILLRKSNGETEKQVFRFQDNGGRDVAMRFDLTVPFARFTAEHKDALYFPFKRYHIAKVWRGEKPQAGRYREFVQCDFDTVGSDSATADFETLALMKAALESIGVKKITIHVNHRAIFNRFLKKIGVAQKSEDILRIVDKISKVGAEKVQEELTEVLENEGAAKMVLDYIQPKSNWNETLIHIQTLSGGENEDTNRLKEIYNMMCAAGIEKTYVLDPSITRGLDYYTGVVYETFLDDLPSLGSVCSGGRYDNLAGLYMKEKVPGVGASIGLDRLIAGLNELNLLEKKGSYLDAEIFNTEESLKTHYQKIASDFRALGVKIEVFPDCAKMNKQYNVTDKKGIPWGILISVEQAQQNFITLKNLITREQHSNISVDEAVRIILKGKTKEIKA